MKERTNVDEGVETDAQLAFLRQYGCETYQGWLFANAMDAASLTMRLRISKAVTLLSANSDPAKVSRTCH